MAIVRPMDQKAWKAWVKKRPKAVRKMAEKWPPDRLYRMEPNGERVLLYSYSEDGTVTVAITGEYNFVTFERQVFGVNPKSLTECDLPPPEEQVGAMLTEEAEIKAFVDVVRPIVLAKRGAH